MQSFIRTAAALRILRPATETQSPTITAPDQPSLVMPYHASSRSGEANRKVRTPAVLKTAVEGPMTVTTTRQPSREAATTTDDAEPPVVFLDSAFRVRSANRPFLDLFEATSTRAEGRLIFSILCDGGVESESLLRDLLMRARQTPPPADEAQGETEETVVLPLCLDGSGVTTYVRAFARPLRIRGTNVGMLCLRLELPTPTPEAELLVDVEIAVPSTQEAKDAEEVVRYLRSVSRGVHRSLALIVGSAQLLEKTSDPIIAADANNITASAVQLMEVMMTLHMMTSPLRPGNPDAAPRIPEASLIVEESKPTPKEASLLFED